MSENNYYPIFLILLITVLFAVTFAIIHQCLSIHSNFGIHRYVCVKQIFYSFVVLLYFFVNVF